MTDHVTPEKRDPIVQWNCSSRCWQEGGPHDENCKPTRYYHEADYDSLAAQLEKANERLYLYDNHPGMAEIDRLTSENRNLAAQLDKWLAWSGGDYPDDSPGDVISADVDGTIVLDDAITTWNPLRAAAFFAAQLEAAQEAIDLLIDGKKVEALRVLTRAAVAANPPTS